MVLQKCFYFAACRRQSCQIQRRASDQGAFVRGEIRTQSLRLQFCQDEVINRCVYPSPIFHTRQLRIANRLKRPMSVRSTPTRTAAVPPRIGCSDGYPAFQQRNLILRELVLRWHLQFWIRVTYGLDQQTLLRFACHNHRPRIASLEQRFPRIELEPAFDFLAFCRVAFVTATDQQWPNLRFEKALPFSRFRRSSEQRQNRKQQRNDGQEQAHQLLDRVVFHECGTTLEQKGRELKLRTP